MTDLTLPDIRAAAERIAPYIIRTPLLASPAVSELLGTRVSLKYELFQVSDSFKPRGAFNKILGLSDEQRARGLLAVSGGNHGKAVAYAARRLDLKAQVLMPQSAAPSAIAYVRRHGAEVQLMPGAAAAFARAKELEAQGLSFVHPYADPQVVAGQGTLGLEILEDAPDLTDVVASVGGGGMVAGVAMAIKEQRPDTRVWGVEPEGAPALSNALAAGQVVPLEQISSVIGTLAPPAASPLTLELAQRYLEDVITLPDAGAMADMVWLLEQVKVLAEPAASMALSAARALRERLTPGGHLVIILCGASVNLEEFARYREQFGV